MEDKYIGSCELQYGFSLKLAGGKQTKFPLFILNQDINTIVLSISDIESLIKLSRKAVKEAEIIVGVR